MEEFIEVSTQELVEFLTKVQKHFPNLLLKPLFTLPNYKERTWNVLIGGKTFPFFKGIKNTFDIETYFININTLGYLETKLNKLEKDGTKSINIEREDTSKDEVRGEVTETPRLGWTGTY